MPEFSSQSGAVIVGSQATAGTFKADMATTGLAVKLRSGSLAGDRELLIPDPEIGSGRDIADAYLGTVGFGGDYEMYARMRAVGFFLKQALGVVNSAATAGAPANSAYTHTITPTDGQLPYFSVYEEISDSLEKFNYTDCVANTFHLEAEANGYLMGTVGILGRLNAADVTDLDPTTLFDNSPLIVGTNITVTYNGITLPASSFSFDINNNVEEDNYKLGDFYRKNLTAKRREITASINMRHETKTTFHQAMYGTTTATSAGGLTTKQPLVITAVTYEKIGASTVPWGITLTLPKVIFQPFAYGPSGDDVLENDIDMQAVRPSTATPILTAAVVNDVAALA